MNRQRIVTILILLAVTVVGVIVARNTYWGEETVPTPMQGEALSNPFYAAQRFAEALGAKTEWQSVLTSLPATDAVIVLSGWHWDLTEERSGPIKKWVESGGRLVLDRTLSGAEADLESWAGITRHNLEGTKLSGSKIVKKSRTDNLSFGKCSLLEVAVREAGANPQPLLYSVCNLDRGGYLKSRKEPSFALSNDKGLQILRVGIGKGHLTLLNAAPFQNHLFRDGDHPRLFAAATQLRRGDLIFFISDDESDSLLRIMWRFGAPVIALFLGLVALALWRGSARFGPLAATADTARRSLGEQIRGTGAFTLRFGGGQALRAAAVRALFEAARRRIVNFDGLPADERMAALARAARLDEGTLSEAINFAGPRRPGELRNTLALLESARRMILKPNER